MAFRQRSRRIREKGLKVAVPAQIPTYTAFIDMNEDAELTENARCLKATVIIRDLTTTGGNLRCLFYAMGTRLRDGSHHP
jgi:hypothetical protein